MSERDALVLSLLEYVTPLLRRYAAQYRRLLNYDDMYQDASVAILRLIDAGTPESELKRFSYVRVRSRIIDKMKYQARRQAASLDAPLTNGTPATLADFIPSEYSIDPARVLVIKERLEEVYAILWRLPPGVGRVKRAQAIRAALAAV